MKKSAHGSNQNQEGSNEVKRKKKKLDEWFHKNTVDLEEGQKEPKPTIELNALRRLRESIEIWEELHERVKAKPHAQGRRSSQLALTIAEETLLQHLQPLVPDPQSGVVGMVGALFGGIADVLGIDFGHVCLLVNDPSPQVEKMALELERLLNEKDPDPKEVSTLTAEVEPHVLIVPFRLYKKAMSRNLMAWAYAKAPKNLDKDAP